MPVKDSSERKIMEKEKISELENSSITEAAYIEKVTELADKKSSVLIPNGYKSHAKVLIHQMLLRATTEMKFFSSYLDPDIYDDPRIIRALKELLARKGIKLEILLQEPEKMVDENGKLTESEFLKLCKSSKDNCTIKTAKEEHKNIPQHFTTMDDDAYRFCKNKDILEAVASFNRPDTVRNLKEQFNRLFKDALIYN